MKMFDPLNEFNNTGSIDVKKCTKPPKVDQQNNKRAKSADKNHKKNQRSVKI